MQPSNALICRLLILVFGIVGLVGVVVALTGLVDIVTNRTDSLYMLASNKVTSVSDRIDGVNDVLVKAIAESGELEAALGASCKMVPCTAASTSSFISAKVCM